jgi:hypothetical protein
MHRQLKAAGLILSAALILGALTAQAASATTHTFDSERADTFITAASLGKQVFYATPKTNEAVECSSVSITHTNKENGEELVNDGTLLGELKETNVYLANKLNVRFTYAGCEWVKHKGEPTEERSVAYVYMNDCYYAFEDVTSEIGKAGIYIKCPSGGHILVKVTALQLPCIAVAEQGVNGGTYSNTHFGEGASRDFDIKIAVTNTVSTTESGCGKGEHTGGTYNGEVTISGTTANVGGSQVGVWVT